MVTQQTAIPDRFLRGAAHDAAAAEIHPDDAPTVALFFALSTQWRRHAFTGQRMGLDYAAIKPTADLAGLETSPATLPAIRAMEDAALQAWAETSR